MGQGKNHRPRIGVPWRTAKQERAGDTRYNRDYLRAVKDAGGNPVQVSLLLPPGKLAKLAASLDAVVLPGSPADVNPKRYRSARHDKTAAADVKRENTDIALLKHAFAAHKPVLAICYGTQLLNVYRGGTLVQDISSELQSRIRHEYDRDNWQRLHPVRLSRGRLAKLAGRATVRVNSSHHQSILRPGRGLRVTAHASDGVVEAVESIVGPEWVVGVQWHPERMRGAFARALFSRLVAEARAASNRRRSNLRGRRALPVQSGSRTGSGLLKSPQHKRRR